MRKDNISSIEIAEKYAKSLTTAAQCRYEASKRLLWKSKIAFFTTTTLSAGLIFVNVYQLGGFKEFLPNNVMTFFQIFLSVTILIYSIVNTKARYSARAVLLDSCGDEIKKLSQKIGHRVSVAKIDVKTTVQIEDIQNKYHMIKIDVENHSQIDYKKIKFFKNESLLTNLKDALIIFGNLINTIFSAAIIFIIEIYYLLQVVGIIPASNLVMNTIN